MLTQTQQIVLDELIKFIQTDKKSIALIGKAGVGKTTVVQELLNQLKGFKILNICVLAPTHKALSVIKNTFGHSNYTFKTLHSFLFLEPNILLENFDPEKPEFVQFKTVQDKVGNIYVKQIIRDVIVFIDESSMINNKLLDYLLSSAKEYNWRFVFIGDKAQLPPVNDSVTNIFNPDFHTVLELTEIMRTKNLDIQDYCNRIRNRDFTLPESSENVRVIKKSDYIFDDDVILAYRNDTVDFWSRQYKLFNNSKELIVGDRIVFHSSVQETNNCSGFKNGEIVQISKLWYDDDEKQFLQVKTTDDRYFTICYNKNYYLAKYTELLNKAKFYVKEYNSKKGWAKFFDFKNSNLLIKPIENISRDISLAYSLSIHKSQGSTFDNVAVDYNDIFGKEKQELLYVAVTRPKKRLTILI